MGQAAIRTRQLVNYRGSVTDYHGIWFVTNKRSDGRCDLRNAYKMQLNNVRPASVTPIEVPRLSEARALALRDLSRRPGTRIGTRERNWLVAQGLICTEQREWDTAPVLRCTALGFELAAALRDLY